VNYFGTYPILTLASSGLDNDMLSLITKAEAWAYEDEYRLIAQERAAATGHDTLKTEGGFLKFPSNALKAVIMGCLISSSHAAEIQTMIQSQYGQHVALKRVVRTRDHYELSIETIVG
jgi:hypothetical protein